MTIQEEIQANLVGRIGLISLVNITPNIQRFISEKEKKLALTDKLQAFLNLDTSNIAETRVFIKKYTYIPSKVTTTWEQELATEQKQIKEIATRYSTGKLTKNDYETIENKLSDMNVKVRMVTSTQLAEFNESLNRLNMNESISAPTGRPLYPINTPEYTTFDMEMWNRLLSLIMSKRPLRKCSESRSCNRFFIPSKFVPNQRFCTLQCKDRSRKYVES